MKSHTFGVGRPTFKHTIITDGQGHIIAGLGGREWWQIELFGGCCVEKCVTRFGLHKYEM